MVMVCEWELNNPQFFITLKTDRPVVHIPTVNVRAPTRKHNNSYTRFPVCHNNSVREDVLGHDVCS